MGDFARGLAAAAVLVVCPLAEAREAWADDGGDIDVRLGLDLELEVVDVEGKGGFENLDPSQQRPDNRSLHAQLDKAVLVPRFMLGERAELVIELRAGDDEAYVDRVYVQTPWIDVLCPPGSWQLRAEIGKDTPLIRPSRRTEAYPLIGTAFWRGREYHAELQSRWQLGPVTPRIGLVVAEKRPLGVHEVGEDEALPILALDDAHLVLGTNLTYGGLVAVEGWGAELVGYGFTGELMSSADTQFLDQNLRGYRALGDRNDRTHYYAGARARYTDHGVGVIAEALTAKDGLLPRTGWYLQGSYDVGQHLHLDGLRSLEPLVQYGRLDVDKLARVFDESASWDRRQTVLALLVGLGEVTTVKLEYYLLDERTGGATVADNQLMVQLKVDVEGVLIHKGGSHGADAE